MPEIMTIPVLSTKHLPSRDALRDLSVMYAKYPYGFFVYMDESSDEPWFVAVHEWAKEHSPSGWVRFDCDADTVPDLPVFDW